MKQEDFFPWNILSHCINRNKGDNQYSSIEDQNLEKQSCKFTVQDPGSADRMRKKKFCCMSLFLFRQHRDPAHGSVQSSSKSEDIATFNSVETGQGAKAYLIHAKGSTKIPHS